MDIVSIKASKGSKNIFIFLQNEFENDFVKKSCLKQFLKFLFSGFQDIVASLFSVFVFDLIAGKSFLN